MPSGHTDRTSINQRRPLTPEMRALLEKVWLQPVGRFSGHRLDTATKSRMRALMDRGLVVPDPAGWWTTTEAGREELQAR